MPERIDWKRRMDTVKYRAPNDPWEYVTMGTPISARSTIQRLRRVFGPDYQFGREDVVIRYRWAPRQSVELDRTA